MSNIASVDFFSSFANNLRNNTSIPVVIAETGTKISPYPFEVVKFDESKKLRISILLDQMIGVKLHYFDGVGYIFCNGGKCCQLSEKKSSVRYLYPCVVYTDTNANGKLIGDSVEVKLLKLGNDAYESICSISEIHEGHVVGLDLICTCTDSKYQKVYFNEAGDANWIKSEKIKKQVEDYMKANFDHILDGVAKPYEEDKLEALVKGSNMPDPSVPAIATDNMDELFT